MSVEAETMMKRGAPPKRRLRNYLLDPRFQLKYTAMVVGVTVLVAGVLGYFAYKYSEGQTEALMVQMATMPELPADTAGDIEAMAKERDREVLLKIVAGILILAVALGITGIIVTHKVVGPAYKMRKMLGEVAEGHLKMSGRLRKGDELQELFDAFAAMIEALRSFQAGEVTALDEAISKARDAGVPDDALAAVVNVRDRMAATLD